MQCRNASLVDGDWLIYGLRATRQRLLGRNTPTPPTNHILTTPNQALSKFDFSRPYQKDGPGAAHTNSAEKRPRRQPQHRAAAAGNASAASSYGEYPYYTYPSYHAASASYSSLGSGSDAATAGGTGACAIRSGRPAQLM